MLKIISSPPFDDYSKRLFYQSFGQKKKLGLSNASFLYLWTGPLCNEQFSYTGTTLHRENTNYSNNVINKKIMEQLLEKACLNDIVILFIKDHFRISIQESWVNPIPELSIYFGNLCDYYPNKQFIIVTSLENLNKEIIKNNCKIIPMGGDITNQIDSYMNFVPNSNKSIDAKNIISLNRGPRNHRTYLVSALYGRNLENYGNISHLTWINDEKLSSVIPYDYIKDFGYTIADIGFKKYSQLNQSQLIDSYEIYTKQNDNITNFKQKLENKYSNGIIEFVSETSFNEFGFNITEKTMHFIYGSNFPIMISSPGTVNFLRNMGIDMFDDIIDHSYDTILDPAIRINAAIDLNMDILTSPNLLKTWNKHKYRIDNNISFVLEGKLKDYYTTRFWNIWKNL